MVAGDGIEGLRPRMSFDTDGASRRTVFPYDYSHDDAGGFLLIRPYRGRRPSIPSPATTSGVTKGARLVRNRRGPIRCSSPTSGSPRARPPRPPAP
ncbi:hypothetical protein EAO71_29340 [Streptomyces sp. ms191]|nr:hypothetical protein EAO71_29340 [Streptomyces sp. ms191]